MNVLSFSEARSGLKSVMDAVCKDHEPTVITRVSGDHIVMLSLDDFNGMQETMHLLGTAKNATRLMESIAQLRAGKAKPRDLIKNGQSKNEEQAAG
jgi:antitoxin YefM